MKSEVKPTSNEAGLLEKVEARPGTATRLTANPANPDQVDCAGGFTPAA